VSGRLQKLGVDEVEIRPGRTGQFDVEVDGELRYSRAKTGRFPSDAEIPGMIGKV